MYLKSFRGQKIQYKILENKYEIVYSIPHLVIIHSVVQW